MNTICFGKAQTSDAELRTDVSGGVTMWRLAALVCSLLFALSGLASAQSDLPGYPSKNVTVIVPFVPSGATDIVARVVAGALSIKWGAPVVTENISGAAGKIGARH